MRHRLSGLLAFVAACSNTGGPGNGIVRPTWVGEPRTGERAAGACPTDYLTCPGGGCCPNGSQCNYYSLCRRDPDECYGRDCCPPGWFLEPLLSPSYCFGPRVAVPEGCSSDVPVTCGDLCCRAGSRCGEDGLCRLSSAEPPVCPSGSSLCEGVCCPDGSGCTVVDAGTHLIAYCQQAPAMGSAPVTPSCPAGHIPVRGCCGKRAACCPDVPGVHCDDNCTECAVPAVQATPCPPEAPRLIGGYCCPTAATTVWASTCVLSWVRPECPADAPILAETGCCPGLATQGPAGEACCGVDEWPCSGSLGGCCPTKGYCDPDTWTCQFQPGIAPLCPESALTACGNPLLGALCCPPDSSCLGEHLCTCPAERPVRCGDDCLPEGESCGGCPADHPTLCVASGECCLPGVECDVVEGCPCPSGTVACAGFLGDRCCPPEAHCIDGKCMLCPGSAPVPCRSNCCAQTYGGDDAGFSQR